MSDWTKQRLQQLVDGGVEENIQLEYKRAAALAKDDAKKTEMTKDISAFANSAGGVIIYGIAEPSDRTKRHLPERIDAVRRADFSKEWLEQIIQTIQPRIEGILIHPVTINETAGEVCYVLEVPQSNTAHQARDHVYYKRNNFNTLPMVDYEIRDVMNRLRHPRICASVFVNRQLGDHSQRGIILVKLENIGQVLAHHAMVELELPMDMHGLVSIDKPVRIKDTEEGRCFILRLRASTNDLPIFPSSHITLERGFDTNVRKITDESGRVVPSSRSVNVSVFADAMPPLQATLLLGSVIAGWTPAKGGRPC